MTSSDRPEPSTDDLVRKCAREWKARGARRAPTAGESDYTMLSLDGDSFLAQRLRRAPTPHEANLFWAEVGS